MKIKPGQLQINDIVFSLPPQSIQIIKRDNNLEVPTLRSATTSKVKSGFKETIFVIDFVYATGYNYSTNEKQTALETINKELVPLIIQVRKCPFCYIENEKIRTEMAEELGTTDRSMAGAITSIRVTLDAQVPELLKCQLTIKWFNYLPFSRNFHYRKTNQDGSFSSVANPKDSDLYRKFYTFQTVNPMTQQFINSLTDISHGMEFFYKEYFDPAEKGTTEPPDNEGWTLFTPEKTGYGRDLGRPIYYRYVNFQIDPLIKNESGCLVPTGFDAVFTTRVPSLQLLSHDTPTLQYLGSSDVSFAVTLFANADLQDGVTPIGTSKQLSKLQMLISSVNRNATKYRSISKRDPIYIKNPLLKLFMYNFDTTLEQYVTTSPLNEAVIGIHALPKIDCIPVIVQSVNSNTIPGMPYASEVELSFTESNKRFDYVTYTPPVGPLSTAAKNSVGVLTGKSLNLTNSGLGRTYFDVAIAGLDKVVDTWNIAWDAGQQRYVTHNASLGPTPEDSSLSVIPAVLGRPTSDYFPYTMGEFLTKNNPPGNTDPKAVYRSVDDNSPIKEYLEVVTNNLRDFAVTTRPDYLSDYLQAIDNFNTLAPTPCYGDMLLPPDESSDRGKLCGMRPDFYFFCEDDKFKSFKDVNAIQAMQNFDALWVKSVDATLAEKAAEEAGRPVRPMPTMPLAASNQQAAEANEKIPTSQTLAHSFDRTTQNQIALITLHHLEDPTYTLRRTMPTFKLYFLRDQPFGSKMYDPKNLWVNFEDYYEISAIKEIRLVKSKNIAADTLVIQMVNLNNDLFVGDIPDYDYKSAYGPAYAVEEGPDGKMKKIYSRTQIIPKKAGSIDQLMLNEGVRIHLRMGCDTDPENLKIEFNGRISQIMGTDLLEIVCVSHAIELELELKGTQPNGESFSYNAETKELLAWLLNRKCPEIRSFGTRGENAFFKTTDIGGRWFGGQSVMDNIVPPSLGYNTLTQIERAAEFGAGLAGVIPGSLTAIGAFIPGVNVVTTAVGVPSTVVMMAVGAAVGGAIKTPFAVWHRFFKPTFCVYNQTFWDVFKELELRHTDCVASVVPYDTRMTMFFGYPEQLYFYRGYTVFDELKHHKRNANPPRTTKETFLHPVDTALNFIGKSGGQIQSQREYLNAINHTTYDDVDHRVTTQVSLIGDNPDLINMAKYLKPFRNYHMVSSEFDIIENNIRADASDTFNSVKIMYPSKAPNLDGSVGYSDYKEYYDIEAEDSIMQDFIRKGGPFIQHNARNESGLDLARCYSMSILKKSLQRLYKGELVILGRAGIKPYDIICIYDLYNNIIGAIEVEEVIQTLSLETGWITEIIPNMIIFSNNSAGMAQLSVVQQVYAAQYYQNAMGYYKAKFGFGLDTPSPMFDITTPGQSAAVTLTDVGIETMAAGLAIRVGTTTLPASLRTVYNYLWSLTGSAAGKAALKGSASILGAVTQFVMTLALESVGKRVVHWATDRDPLIFIPLYRAGQPWILGMYGMRFDTKQSNILYNIDSVWTKFKDTSKFALEQMGITHKAIGPSTLKGK